MPTNSPLQTTEDSQPPNETPMTNHQKKKTPARKKDVAIQLLIATLQLNKKVKRLNVPLQFRQYENHGLSEVELRRILSAHPAAILEEYPAPDFNVQIEFSSRYNFAIR